MPRRGAGPTPSGRRGPSRAPEPTRRTRLRANASAAHKPGRQALVLDRASLAALRADLAGRTRESGVPRWNPDSRDVQRAVGKLVLSLVEFLRRLFERQALRRLDEGTLSPAETEALGLGLMRLERTVRELARRFDLDPAELSLDLGPLGRLM